MSRKKALKSIAAVNEFMEETGALWNQHEHKPSPISQASRELAEFIRPESVGTAFSQGAMLIEAAADHAFTVIKTLTEPAGTISPWACARAVLETSALSIWFFDTSINVDERVRRSFAFHYEGLYQKKMFMQSTKGMFDAQAIDLQIDEIEKISLRLGFAKVVDRNGKRIGVGQQMPSITKLVTTMLNKEQEYRLLSAMTHAHPWALQHFGFIKTQDNQIIFENVKGSHFEKHLSPESILFLCVDSINNLFSSLLMNFNLFGWDPKPLATAADNAIKKIKSPD